LVGTTTLRIGEPLQRFNSSLLLSPSGDVQGSYYKMHRVMFGEYIPIVDLWPSLYRWTPMPDGLTAGQQPATFEVAGYRVAPSICFESTVPHLIRRQIVELERQDKPVDMLVNMTNDGWFWGSGILDLHYRCGVFRAVENRKPMLVAANTGFSAIIDGNGHVLEKGPRRAAETLVAEVPRDGRQSYYTRYGDVFAGLCLTFTALVGGVGIVASRAEKKLLTGDKTLVH
jgi:apolipoprotein N-acyltransferase